MRTGCHVPYTFSDTGANTNANAASTGITFDEFTL